MTNQKQKEIKEKALILQVINESIIDLENLRFLIRYTKESDFFNKKESLDTRILEIKNKLTEALDKTKYWD